MNLFTLNPKRTNKKTRIYWVIQEFEHISDRVLVKFFNDKNEVIFEETLFGVFQGVIDEVIIQKLNQTREYVLRNVA